MATPPIYDDTTPIVCTIGDDEAPDRLDLLERLRATLTVAERTDHGLLLRLPARDDVEADVRRFAADERRCCQFWGFDVTATDMDVTLRWDGPPATAHLLDHLPGYFRGHQPVTAVTGLL